MARDDLSPHSESLLAGTEGVLVSPKAKGERLKRIRHLTNLTREEFCEGSEINLATLISWEVGRFGGLSSKGAKRVITRAAKEGVFCSLEWLLYEIGAGPKVRVDYKKANQAQAAAEKNNLSEDAEEENAIIIEELMLFRKLHKQAIDFIVDDDGMLPYYQLGDYIAGTKRYAKNIKALIGYDCIIQTKDGHLTFRKLQMGPRDNSFNLVCVNLQAKTKDLITYDVELATAAPVIWHRKKEPILVS